MPDFVNYDNTDIESNLLVDNNSPGLMSKEDKKKLNGLPGVWYGSEKEYENIATKDPNILYITKPPVAKLISGQEFKNILTTSMSSIMPLWVPDVNGTYKIVFTKTAIPSDKISSATIVSTEDSDIKIYMYKFDKNGVFSIYISPEIDGATIYANEDCSYMFNCDLDIRSINFSNFNTINTTNMRYMFYNCKLLTSLDLSSFDTSNVTDAGYMFYGCTNLSGNITIMNPNIISYDYMFDTCSTDSSAKFIVKYVDGCKNVAQNMVNTKSSNSNVFLYTTSTLITGKEFNTKLINLARGVTRAPEPGVACDVIFTKTAIPSDKISSAIIVSTEDSESKVYMYKEDTGIRPEIYICPEIDNGIIYANEDCSYMFNSDLILSVNLSNLNTSNITNMTSMFQNAIWLSGSIIIMNPNITEYDYMFLRCSTYAGAKFTVNYKSGCQTMAQAMVNTKSSDSNVVLGSQV